MKKKMEKKKNHIQLSGSFTVEASFIFPLLLFVVALSLRLAIWQYEEVRAQAEEPIALENIEPVETLRNIGAAAVFWEAFEDED